MLILQRKYASCSKVLYHTTPRDITTTVLRPFFRDNPGEPVPEENFWSLWCKGRLTEADSIFALAAKYYFSPHDVLTSSLTSIREKFWNYLSDLM